MAGRAADYDITGIIARIIRFSLVGAANTVIDFLIFTIFHQVFGTGYLASQAIGYSAGIANSFILNKRWTFEDKSSKKEAVKKLVKFVSTNLITLGITLVLMNLLVKTADINVYIAKVIVTFAAQVSNFLIYKLWIFK